MKNPTTIKKSGTKKGESTFFTIEYNGKELGQIIIANIMTVGGTQGLRIVWQETEKPLDFEKRKVFEYTDKDEQGNIITTK